MTFIDFCAGIGGGRLGLELNGLKCLAFSEIDKEAINTYTTFYNTKSELNLGDITAINPQNLIDFDILISGFPCQSFSINGKREGLQNQEKGQIIFYIVDILKAKKPSFFILENVKGLVNHDKGRTLKIINELLLDCGYKVSYKVLNSKKFGLAQSRERIYFIGIRNDIEKNFSFDDLVEKQSELKDFLSPKVENKFDKQSPTFVKYINNKYNKNRINLSEILADDFVIVDTRQSDLRIYKDTCPTLRRDRQGILYVFQGELYKLSSIEALKLQGFDKLTNLNDKIVNLKTSDILRQCGNAMSVNVIEAIVKRLING
ncbi:cytosine-specific DNA methyltransferase [Campylobacter iguaniorum]|uniref:Cytosine-specific methyltransferase n=1 Tax=Campylobacter iguaniorum TaxID=1244531 RepID=A0A076FDI0_9BACT|nr:DNA (cytosine-5-)-methyltransferase [Campylobacter iguaniorum]AII15442.1 cytosine-specific DNA methyltransferase [Campylobacter iguaniorum]